MYKDKPKYDLDEVMKQKNQIGILVHLNYMLILFNWWLDQELTSFTHSPMINK